MESKTLATVLIIVIGILLFPIALGIVGGMFGLIGGLIGGFFGLIGGLFGAVISVITSIFGAIFSVIGGIFGWHHNWNYSFDLFDGDVVAGVVVVLVIVMIARSRRPESQKRAKP